jgi:ABC-2 type transport system ATP-binding protein
MRVRRLISTTAAAALAAAGLAAATTGSAAAAPSITVTPLHFEVAVGPGGGTSCDIVGDLYLPTSATAKKPVPAILTTNGFGGSKDDQSGIGRVFAQRGYAVLSYSGLGFGGSDCKITLDDPDVDGVAASQLVSYLGGKTGIAFTDDAHTTPAPALKVVRKDTRDHAGRRSTFDPRVGMVGGSYGGQVQYAAASVDPRIDTIIPLITWMDLSYSLSPNNTSQVGDGVSTSTPGAAKLVWALGFSGLGVLNGVQNAPTDPNRLVGCPNFASFVCPALITAATTGTLDATATRNLRHASLSSYVDKVTIPTLIMQGQTDTLFNLNEGVAAYRALKKQGTPVKMVWFNGGHSGPNAPGEVDFTDPDPATQHLAKRVADWFDHYLKGTSASTGPAFTYFRDWVSYSGNAKPAYASASSYPVGTQRRYTLSGDGALATSATKVTTGTSRFTTPVAGVPTSTDPLDVIGSQLPLPEIDLPGSFAAWSTAALGKPVDVVGSPVLKLQVTAPTARLTQGTDAGKLVLFAKIADVAPDGTSTIVRDLVAPVRVPDVSKPFTVTLPAFAHRFATGHRIKLIVAGGSTNYRGGLVPTPVAVRLGTATQSLSLPTL